MPHSKGCSVDKVSDLKRHSLTLTLTERQVGTQGEVGEGGDHSRQTGEADAQRQTKMSHVFCGHSILQSTNEVGRGRGLECHAQKRHLDPGGGSLCSRGGLSGLVSPSLK